VYLVILNKGITGQPRYHFAHNSPACRDWESLSAGPVWHPVFVRGFLPAWEITDRCSNPTLPCPARFPF